MLFLLCVLVATNVSGQAVPPPSEPLQATLFSRIQHKNKDYGRSAFNFQHGVRSDDKSWNQTARGYYHLLYGSISINGDSDWFGVPGDGEDSTRIKDLGVLQWSQVYFTPFLPANPHPSGAIRWPRPGESLESSSEERVTKVIAGHMYVVHIKNKETDLYVMFRVDELVPSDKCSISWKLVPSPEK